MDITHSPVCKEVLLLSCLSLAGTWLVEAWMISLVSGRSVGLVSGIKVLVLSTALAGEDLVGVTFTVWKVGCSASFSNVFTTNIASSRDNLPDHLASKGFKSLSIEDLDSVLFLDFCFALITLSSGNFVFTAPKTDTKPGSIKEELSLPEYFWQAAFLARGQSVT